MNWQLFLTHTPCLCVACMLCSSFVVCCAKLVFLPAVIAWQLFEEVRDKLQAKYHELQVNSQVCMRFCCYRLVHLTMLCPTFDGDSCVRVFCFMCNVHMLAKQCSTSCHSLTVDTTCHVNACWLTLLCIAG